MNYNALLVLDKYHKYKTNNDNDNDKVPNNKKIYSLFKSNYNIYIDVKENKKADKYYSVKPSSYMMPKDITLRDIFKFSIKTSKDYIKVDEQKSKSNNADRKQIFKKIKKFIKINHINYYIFTKTIFLYDLLCYEIGKISSKNKKYSKFYSLPNMYIALIAFILVLKFNYEENKMISLKKFVKKFEEKNEIIEFDDVCEMEIVALKLIKYNLIFQTPFTYLELFLINGIVFSEDNIHYNLSYNIYSLVNETLEKIMETSNEYFYYNYFYLSCSVIMHIREKFNIGRWPKALEISFDVNFDNFYDVYNYFFNKDNKKENNNKHNIKSFYNSDIININNLKNASNIINVLKIMKSAEKFRKGKTIINTIDSPNKINEKGGNIIDNKNNNTINSNKIKVEIKKKWHFFNFKSPQNINMPKASISSALIKMNSEIKNSINNTNKNYNSNNDNKDNLKNEERMKIKSMKSDELIKKRSFKFAENKNNKIDILKRCKENKSISSLFDIKEMNNNENDNNNEKLKETKTINNEEVIKTITIKNSENNINKHYKIYKKSITSQNYANNYHSNNIKNNIINYNYTTNTNIESYYSVNTLNINYYKKRNYMNKKTIDIIKNDPEMNDKEMQNSNLNNKNNINSYNILNSNHNYKIKNRCFYNNCTEKKRNSNLNNNNSLHNNKSSSFNDFLFYKNNIKNNSKNMDNENYFKNIKHKEENSNVPTCESSNLKLSINDFSIRKSYKEKLSNKEIHFDKQLNLSPINEKNKKFEKEGRKVLEKNKSYNKLLGDKLLFSENTYNRKTGVRKFYKQKNSRENQILFS